MKHTLLLTGLLVFSACTPVTAPADNHSTHSESGSIASADAYLDRLVNSPRHSEWVMVKNGEKTIHTWVVYPERTDKAPVVVLIHENRGLNNWARSMSDQVAEAGYIAVAPDLLSEFSSEFPQTRDFPDEDAARTAIGELDAAEVQSDLKAVTTWAKTIPAGNGKIASAGFCWGGSQSFALAAESDDLDAALVFYGTGPENPATYAKIDTPVFGFYGGADERVNASIEGSENAMDSAGNPYEYVVYEGAGHAFMRLGEDPNGEAANKAARDAAWERMKNILSEL